MNNYLLPFYLQYFSFGLSSFFSFYYLFMGKSKPIKIFCLYPIFAFTISNFNVLWVLGYFPLRFAIINNIFSLIFHYSFLGFFLMTQFEKKANVKSPFLFLFLATFISIIYIITKDKPNPFPSPGIFALSNSIIVILCLNYFLDLFKISPNKTLLKEPFFWFTTGIFICIALTVPIFLSHRLLKNSLPNEIFNVMNSIIGFSYCLMHFFIIKGILCSLRQEKAL